MFKATATHTGKFPDASKIRAALNRVLDDAAQGVQTDFEGTSSTFKVHKPEFIIAKSQDGRVVYTDNDIYYYLNFGTRIRYAVLSRDWQSKTQPLSLIPTGGAGRVFRISRKLVNDGIEARKFDVQLQQKWQPLFVQMMTGALSRL